MYNYHRFSDLCGNDYLAYVKANLGYPCLYEDISIFILLPTISDPPNEDEVDNIMSEAHQVALHHASYVRDHYEEPGKDDTKNLVGNESYYKVTITPPIPAMLKSESSVERLYLLNNRLTKIVIEASKEKDEEGDTLMDAKTLNVVNMGDVLNKLANLSTSDDAPAGANIIKEVLKTTISLPTCPEEFKTPEASAAIKKLIFNKDGSTQEAFLYSLLSTTSNAQAASQRELQDSRTSNDVKIRTFSLPIKVKKINSHEDKREKNGWLALKKKNKKIDSEKAKSLNKESYRQDWQVIENTNSIKSVKEELIAKNDQVRTATDDNRRTQTNHTSLLVSFEAQLTTLKEKVEKVSKDAEQASSMLMVTSIDNLERRMTINEGKLEKDENLKKIAAQNKEIATLKEKIEGLSRTNHTLNQEVKTLNLEVKTKKVKA